MKLTDERRQLALNLRSKGKTFKEIGKIMGVCAGRAKNIYDASRYWKQSQKNDPLFGLSVRVRNRLHDFNFETKEQIEKAFDEGKFFVAAKPGHLNSWRNFGWESYKEIALWLGKPEPTKPHTVCPHCGKSLR